mgnify:CR=1 FL=1
MPLREPVVITAPTVEPVSVSEFRANWRRLDFDDEDGNVCQWVLSAARGLLEREAGITLHQTTLEYYLEDWPCGGKPIKLPRAAPLISVTEIGYKDTTGAETIWSSAEWISSTRTLPGRVAPGYGYQYPTETLYPLDPIRIRYVAGIANASPQTYPDERIRVAIMEIASSLFELREPNMLTSSLQSLEVSKLSPEARALIDLCRVEFF